MKGLTAKQNLFVLEYLKDLNATQAAIRAGYSEKTAKEQGYENLTKPHIAEAIQVAMGERSKRVKIEADDVLQEIGKMAFANLADFIVIQKDGTAYVDLSQANREQLAALSDIQVDEYTEGRGENVRNVKRIKLKMAEKKGSLELLGKHLKLFTDRIEINPLSELSDEELDAEAVKAAQQILKEKGLL